LGQQKQNSQRIIVADDDLDTVEAMALLLRAIGHQVDVATSGSAVLELAGRTRPDIIFLDIGMPGMDGWELARRLREQLGTDAVRIVAVTGYGAKEDYLRSRKAGFDAHVQKPVDMALLHSILAQMG
jgi:CheY-like chemotaxis protein